MPEVARMVGVTYHKLWYAHYDGKIPEPARRYGRTRVYGPADVERVRAYFATVNEKRRKKSEGGK
ncbi:MAG TPA: MerR family transcriptional regulator [bacterium]|nr:MerR family transcriptional regulator [bacterium]